MAEAPQFRQSALLEPPPTPEQAPRKVAIWRAILSGIAALCLFVGPLITLHVWPSALRGGRQSSAAPTPTTQYSTIWWGDKLTHAPQQSNAAFGTQQASVDSVFQGYYSAHGGATVLGSALTPGFPTSAGEVQFFQDGALLLPSSTAAQQASAPHISDSTALDPELIRDAVRLSGTPILRLPLLHTLLSLGSQVRIGGADSTLTYADVRAATLPSALVTIPPQQVTLRNRASQDVFVQEGTQGDLLVGHSVPLSIWNYVNDDTNTPNGSKNDFGRPLTEALHATVTVNGTQHRLLVQAFWYALVVLDQDAQTADGQPAVGRATTGADYLLTVGPPHVTVPSNKLVWSTAMNVPVLSAPSTGQPLVHIGQNFPVELAGDTRWVQGALWYSVRWGSQQQTGWVQADALTFSDPGKGATSWASFDVLSPDLASYLASLGGNTGVAVYDVTRNRYYTYNEQSNYIAASSMKVPIMLAFLSSVEAQGRDVTSDEMNLLTAMIENSDNDAAQTLYDAEGGPAAIGGYLQSLGIGGYAPNNDAWGWSTLTPLAMTQLLTDLQEGKTLSQQHQALALSLMQNIESDQISGVGDTAPSGASYAMKDGWVNGPDGAWAINSSGIITKGNETYVISVYSQELGTEDSGWDIARHVCQAVAQALT